MDYLLVLSKKDEKLSFAEVNALGKVVIIDKGKVLLQSQKTNIDRLALSKEAYRVLFSCSYYELSSFIDTYKWNKMITGSYAVYAPAKYLPTIADKIWNRVKNPKVDLSHPSKSITFFFIGKTVYATFLLWKNKGLFNDRRAHLRPGFAPVSLKPKMARVLVNLTGIRKGELLFDPFCGCGGLLIEAGIIGCRLKGTDIDKNMIDKCQKNLTFFNLTATLSVENALSNKKKYNYIVTDLPYGKNTKLTSDLYPRFLAHYRSLVKKKMVITFPHWANGELLLKKYGYVIEQRFKDYIHKSLTKEIFVVSPSK